MKYLRGKLVTIVLMCVVISGCNEKNGQTMDERANTSSTKPVKKTLDVQEIQQKSYTLKYLESFGENGIAKFQRTADANPTHLRIAYFGDSIIEGDIITMDFRKIFQHKFGGSGLGYVPISSPTAAMRPGIKTIIEGEWQSFNLVNRGHAKYFGLDGSVSYPAVNSKSPSSVSFTLSQGTFSTPEFFFRFPHGNGYIELEKADGNKETVQLQNSDDVQIIKLNIQSSRFMKMSFVIDDTLEAFGVMFDGGEGIQIDNLALRGHNGLGLRSISKSFLQAFTRNYKYDLIVLQYGVNVLNDDVPGYGWYQKGFTETLEFLKANFPDAGFLVVSVSDRGKKEGSGFTSFDKTGELVAAQRSAARQFGASFYNLFEAMGGSCSMEAWVENKLAAADYTHLNFKGGSIVAQMISRTIL